MNPLLNPLLDPLSNSLLDPLLNPLLDPLLEDPFSRPHISGGSGYKEEKEMNEVAQWESGGIKPELSQYESRYIYSLDISDFFALNIKFLYDILMQS